VVAWRFRADSKTSVLAAAYLHASRMGRGKQFSDLLNVRPALPSQVGNRSSLSPLR
jgi:hypothetical protein